MMLATIGKINNHFFRGNKAVALDHAQYEAQVDSFFEGLNYWDFEQASCIFCGPGQSAWPLFNKNTMSVVRCDCGFVYSAFQPKQESLDKFYSNSKAMTAWSQIKETAKESLRQRQKFQGAIDTLMSFGVKTVLDLGCGNGKFLSLAKEALPHLEVLGVDQNEDALAFAKSQGVETLNQSLKYFLEKDERRFDAVTLWGVLEHVKDPLWTLKQVAKKLQGPSILIICVPNVDSLVVRTLWQKCATFCPQHLWYFSAETLASAFEFTGIRYIRHFTIEPESRPITKSMYGFQPYDRCPDWAESRYLEEKFIKSHDDMILSKDLGYKVVAIGRT